MCYQENLDLLQEVLEIDCQGEIVTTEEADAIKARRQDHLRRAFSGARWKPQEDLRLVGVGSAFAVSAAGHLVTNHHVVEGCRAVSALTPQGEEAAVRVLRSAAAVDLALLLASAGAPARVPALFAAPQARFAIWPVAGAAGGQTAGAVRFLGYPNQGRPPLTPFDRPGRLWQMTGEVLDVPVIAFKGDIGHGNSGGPLLDHKRRVIGLVFAEANAPAFYKNADKAKAQQMINVGFALPFWEILVFLEQAGVAYQVAPDEYEKGPESDQFMVRINCWR